MDGGVARTVTIAGVSTTLILTSFTNSLATARDGAEALMAAVIRISGRTCVRMRTFPLWCVRSKAGEPLIETVRSTLRTASSRRAASAVPGGSARAIATATAARRDNMFPRFGIRHSAFSIDLMGLERIVVVLLNLFQD